jgi:hypothetical protein
MVTRPTNRFLRIATVVAGVLLLLPVLARAQATGTVTGRVFDQTGAVLPGVTIDLVVNATELTTSSNEIGQYRFDGVPAGPSSRSGCSTSASSAGRSRSAPAGQRLPTPC